MNNSEALKLLLGSNIDLLWGVIEQQQEMIATQRCVMNLLNKELQEAQDTAEKLLDAALAAQSAKQGGDADGAGTEQRVSVPMACRGHKSLRLPCKYSESIHKRPVSEFL